MEHVLLDKLSNYTISSILSVICSVKKKIISVADLRHIGQCQYICDRFISDDKIGKTIYRSGSNNTIFRLYTA